MLKLCIFILVLMCWYSVHRADARLKGNVSDNSIRETAVRASARPKGFEEIRKYYECLGSCDLDKDVPPPAGGSDRPIPVNAGSITSPPGRRSDPIAGSSRGAVRVQPAPRVIYFDRPLGVQREKLACMDYESRVYCEAINPDVDYDER